MWSDNETVDDLIGFRVHADLLQQVVCDKSLLPITIGVFGDWGSGKTSIMKMLQKQLETNEKIAVIYKKVA
jgi:Ni2+-binding GTPase involved in maturation of urease and hydrogenase